MSLYPGDPAPGSMDHNFSNQNLPLRLPGDTNSPATTTNTDGGGRLSEGRNRAAYEGVGRAFYRSRRNAGNIPTTPTSDKITPPGTDVSAPPTTPPKDPTTTTESTPVIPSIDELYPRVGEDTGIGDVASIPGGSVDPVTGARVKESDKSALERNEPVTGANAGGMGKVLQVDKDLARIMSQDSPLLAQARAQAAAYANKRGLMNSSMAAGETYGRMVNAALPMAQQNSQLTTQQNIAAAQNRTQANIASAQMANRAAELTQQLNAAAAAQDAQAYNAAATQLAALERDAAAQQAELNYRAGEQTAAAINARNAQTIDSVTKINQQYLTNLGNADLMHIQGTYNQLIASNNAAATLNNNMLQAMGQIMDNPEMTPSQVATAIAALQKQTEAGLRMIAEINDLDFDETGGTGGGTGPLPGEPTGPRGRRRYPDIV